MAGLEKSNRGGNFNITYRINGKRQKISTHTRTRAIAEKVRQKVNDLEAAYMCGLSPEEAELSEWLELLRTNNPEAYNRLAKDFRLPQIQDGQKVEQHAEYIPEKSLVERQDKILEINNCHYSRIYPDMDRVIYTQTKTRVNIVIFLTPKTARLHKIDTNLLSNPKGHFVEINDGNGRTRWRLENGAYKFLAILSDPPQMERKWEMYAPVFTGDGLIIQGNPLAVHTRPAEKRN